MVIRKSQGTIFQYPAWGLPATFYYRISWFWQFEKERLSEKQRVYVLASFFNFCNWIPHVLISTGFWWSYNCLVNCLFTKVNLPKSQVHFNQPYGHFVTKIQSPFTGILEASKICAKFMPFVNRLKIYVIYFVRLASLIRINLVLITN